MSRRIISLTLLFTLTLSASARTPVNKSDWARVQLLPLTTAIHVINTGGDSHACRITAVTVTDLSCISGNGTVTYHKEDIKMIKIAHRARSAWIGTGIGFFGTLFIGISIADAQSQGDSWNGLGTAVGTVLLTPVVATAGGFIGHYSDFTAGTYYKKQ